jgi:hypothetical protein
LRWLFAALAAIQEAHFEMFNPRFAKFALAPFLFLLLAPSARSQDSKVMGEVRLEGSTKIDRDSGVWVDGNYVGYVKELKGNKKLILLPGQHEIIVRQSGYDDFVQKIVVEPGQTQIVQVSMHLAPHATRPDITSMLKLDIQPGRAAVFLDGKFVGHASEFGGKVHAMLIAPGKHTIHVELPGYRTFETEVNLLPNQKSEVKTRLVEGSITQAGPEIKKTP